MNIDDLLGEFGAQTGLGQVHLNEDRACRLVFEGQWALDIEADAEGKHILMHVRVDSVPVQDQAAYFRRLLQANLGGVGKGVGKGACFAVDRDTDEVLLCHRLILDTTDYRTFADAVESIINCAEAWSERLTIAGDDEDGYDGLDEAIDALSDDDVAAGAAAAGENGAEAPPDPGEEMSGSRGIVWHRV